MVYLYSIIQTYRIGWTILLVSALGFSCTNHKPRLLSIGNQLVLTGNTLLLDVKAVDEDNDPLKLGVKGKPEAATFQQTGKNTARFSWSPLASDAGADGNGKEFPVTFEVTDGVGKDTETVTILVTLGGAGTGAPVFITPADYLLDLDRTDRIEFHVEVRDADSAEVDLRLAAGIEGASLQTTAGGKTAEFSWTPSAAQIAERPVWTVRIGANDRKNPEIFQDLTILLKGVPAECKGAPPTIKHTPLTEQRSGSDYEVVALVTDRESNINSVTLSWQLERDGVRGALQSAPMTASGADTFKAVIPNPKLVGAQSAIIRYYLCAVDNDDSDGTRCDLRACLPEPGQYSFTAYQAGSTSCQDDSFEPNENMAIATQVHFDQNGSWSNANVTICPGTKDFYQILVPANHRLGVTLFKSEGQLRADLLDQDGFVLTSGQLENNEPVVISDVFGSDASVFLLVRGAASSIEQRYEIRFESKANQPCQPDNQEPNNDYSQAKSASPGTLTGLTACGEADWYKIALKKGDRLAAKLLFTYRSDGDLDLAVYDQLTLQYASVLTCDNALACAATQRDNEQAIAESIPGDGTYYIAMVPYKSARNSYQLVLNLTQQAHPCSDDASEPNDNPFQSVSLTPGPSGVSNAVCMGNQDWYKVHLGAKTNLKIELGFTPTEGDLDVRLYDALVVPGELTAHQLAAGISMDGPEEICYRIASEADYYIMVSGWKMKQNRMGYTLKVTQP